MGRPAGRQRVFKKRNTWYVDITVDGRRRRVAAGRTRAEAERLLEDLTAGVLRGNVAQGHALTIAEMVSRFLARRQMEVAPNTCANNRWMLKPFVTQFGSLPADCLSDDHIQRFLESRHRGGLKSRWSLNAQISALRALYTWATSGRTPLLSRDQDPTRDLKRRRPPLKAVHSLSPETCTALIRSAEGHLKVLLACCYYAGMRPGEVLDLTWEHVDFRRKLLTIEASKTGDVRQVPMHAELLTILKAWKPDNARGLVIPSPVTGKRINNVKRSLASLSSRLGVDRVRLHQLRHSFATHVISAGHSAATAQNLLGHKSIVTTIQTYHDVLDASKVAAVNALPSLVMAKKGSSDRRRAAQ